MVFYYFRTEVAYYDLKMIATILTVVRLWVIVNDSLMGMFIDTRSFKNREKLHHWLKTAWMFIVAVRFCLWSRFLLITHTYVQYWFWLYTLFVIRLLLFRIFPCRACVQLCLPNQKHVNRSPMLKKYMYWLSVGFPDLQRCLYMLLIRLSFFKVFFFVAFMNL